jgi:O-antigen ligase
MYVPAVFFAQYVIRNKSDIFKLVRYFSYVMIVAAVYGLIQMGLRMPTTYSILSPANTTVKFLYSSFFPDYNMLGWFSAVTFGLVFPFRRFYGSDRLLTRAALIFSVFWLVAAQSRTAIISLGAVLFVLFVFGRLKPGRLLIIAAIAVGVLFLFWSGILLHHRLRGGVLGDLRFTQAWPVLWAVYKSRPFFGYGFGVFGFAALREGIDIIGLRGRAGVGVDNFYLTLLLNTGLFGLLLFAALVFTVLNRLRAIVKLGRDRPTTDFLIGIFLGIVVCLVYGIPTNLLEGFPVGVYFWFLVGCSFSAYANEMGCQSPRSEVIERSSRRVVC